MELVLIEPYSKEWNYMWEWLANHPINDGIEDPSTALHENEAWQYVGSYKQNDKVIHTLRHRNHPLIQGVKNLSLNASDGFNLNDINKTFKL